MQEEEKRPDREDDRNDGSRSRSSKQSTEPRTEECYSPDKAEDLKLPIPRAERQMV